MPEASDQVRILVVEDEGSVAKEIEDTLTELGYLVVGITATGEEAIEQARQRQPHLVLMDVRLAGTVDGVSAAIQIRKERDIPVIYLTSLADEETLRRVTDTRRYGYLVKPFRTPELRCAIESALHKHEIEARLGERTRWLTTILSSIEEGVIATDGENRIRLVNPVAEAVTGWKQEEALGRTLGEIMKRSGATHKSTPIVGEPGQVLGGITVFPASSEGGPTDVTESAEETGHLHAELERRLAERTEQLEAVNKEMEAFSYSVAQDLRVPLQGLDKIGDAILDDQAGRLGAEGLDHLRRVREASRTMTRLIDDLLRLSGVTQGGFVLVTVDLSRLARVVKNELQMASPGRQVEVVIEDEIIVEGDPDLLKILLQNLLGNAWKFTSQAARPKIEFATMQKDGKQIYFVRDNGVGFDMSSAGRLFSVFERLHPAGEFKGSGVGLAIARRVINRHGGRIWAESSVGQGATFYFVV